MRLGVLAGVKRICSASLTLFCLQIDEACPTPNKNPLCCRAACELESGTVLICASTDTEEWQQDGGHPLLRK